MINNSMNTRKTDGAYDRFLKTDQWKISSSPASFQDERLWSLQT